MLKLNLMNLFSNIATRITTLGFFDNIWKMILNTIMRLVYGLYFGFIKAIAWVLDMLTQLFFIFAGMTPVGTTNAVNSDEGIDIVNFFLTQKSFQKAYLYLCLIALGLIIVFAIAKIIKQDYFDRSGPRSKAPIFRNIALSFIAFICIIPIFYFMIDAVGALALLVMKAMGYKGGGIGSMLFNISWEDGGDSIRAIGVKLRNPDPMWGDLFESKVYDPDNFGWYSLDTFYAYYWDTSTATKMTTVNWKTDLPMSEFYWYMFIATGLILIVNLAQMMIAMVTRLFKLISLFLVAPSPISQIVLDDGQKFKGWKDAVIQEALKVVGCVMSFMIYVMIASFVPQIDLMKFAFTDQAATASLLESNNMTTELSNSVSALYYYGDSISWVDKAINALGRCMILIAGVGAIKDIDQTITPFISGGKSSMDLGNTGAAINAAGKAAGAGALAITRKGVGLAVSGASAAVGLGAGAIGSLAGAGAEGARSLASVVGADGRPTPNTPTDGGNDNPDDSAQNPQPTGGPTDGAPTDDAAANPTETTAGAPTDETPVDDAATDATETTAEPTTDETSENDDAASTPELSPVDEAKDNLDDATRRDNNKNVILDEMQKLSDKKPEDRTPEEQNRLEQLEKAFNQVDESGDTLHDAQNKYDAAVSEAENASGDAEPTEEAASTPETANSETSEAAEESSTDDAATTPDGATPEDTPETTIEQQKAKVQEARGKMDKAKQDLEAAKKRDNKKNEILGNIEAIEKSKSMSDEEKQEKIARLDKQYNELDAEGPSLQDAQAEYDAAKATHDMEKRDLEAMGGKEDTPGASAPTPSNSENSSVGRTVHDQNSNRGPGKWAAKIALGGLAGATRFATKAGFGIAGKALKTGVSFAGTATKSGLSIAGIMAKTALQMVGWGGVANAVGGTVKGIAEDTIKNKHLRKAGKQIVQSGKEVAAAGKDMAETIKYKRDENGNFVDASGNAVNRDGMRVNSSGQLIDADGNAVNKDGYRINEKGEIMKDSAGKVIQGGKPVKGGDPVNTGIAVGAMKLGNKVKNSKFGKFTRKVGGKTAGAFGATGRFFTSSGTNAFVAMSKGVDKIGNIKKDKTYKDALDDSRGKEEISSGMAAVNNGTVDSTENVVKGAADVNDGVNQVMAQADTMNDVAGQVGTANRELTRSDVDIEALSSEANRINTENQASYEHLTAVESFGASRADGRMEDFATLCKNFEKNTKGGIQRLAANQGVYEANKKLKEEYADVIAKKASGATMTAEESSRYSQYLSRGQKLDNAYRFVNGDTSVGQEAYDAVKNEIEDTVMYKNVANCATDPHFNNTTRKSYLGDHGFTRNKLADADSNYQKEMEERASAGSVLADAKADEFQSRFESEMSKTTAYDRVQYYQSQFNNSRNRYDRAVASGNADRIADANADLMAWGSDLQGAVSELRSQMATTKDVTMKQSKKNVKAGGNKVVLGDVRTGGSGNGSSTTVGTATRGSGATAQTRRQETTVTVGVPANADATNVETTQESVVEEPITETVVNVEVQFEDIMKHHNQIVGPHGAKGEDIAKYINAIKGSSTMSVSEDITDVIEKLKKSPLKGTKVKEYKKQASDRYNTAVTNYNNHMETARRLAGGYRGPGDEATLKAIEREINYAAGEGEKIETLRVELGIKKEK